MKSITKLILFILSIFIRSSWSYGKDAGRLVTQDFQNIEAVGDSLPGGGNPQDLLIVWDIDNTLLKMKDDFGSEQWYIWQKELIEGGQLHLPSVTPKIADLLRIQTSIYENLPMEQVDSRQPHWITSWRQRGAGVIAITSRVLEVKNSTLGQLSTHGIYLSQEQELQFFEKSEPYLPYDIRQPNKDGLDQKDILDFSLDRAKPVLFKKGVLFTQGQHKGVMLKAFLFKLKRKFKYVIFIDDRIHHVDGVQKISSSMREEVFSIHFHLSEKWTLPFFRGDKARVQKQWCDFAAWMTQNSEKIPPDVKFHTCP